MKNMRKEVEYESPMLQVIEVEMEQTIAGSQKIEGDEETVTETWQDETLNTADIDLYL